MKITIDGHPIDVKGRPTILEIARKNGIDIPSLCEHPDLVPFTGCRICLVKIKGWKSYTPACGTTPEDGMEILTATPRLQRLRKNILELILSEHPHACLICSEKSSCDDFKSTIRKVGEVTGCVLCPQNGRCHLQKTVETLGLNKVDYPAHYRNLEVRKEDPFFDRDPNTCILCGKCIRVCQDVRGANVLAFIHRGGPTVIGTAMDRSLLQSGCQFCGACVDICPTGALVERAVRPQMPPEKIVPFTCPFCGQGCALEAGVLQNRILFTRPKEKGAVNRGQGCVRGRFLIRDCVSSPQRIREPWIRKDGSLVPVDWDEALSLTASRLKAYAAGQTAVVFSRQLPLEDAYLAMQFARKVLKTNRVTSFPSGGLWEAWSGLAEVRGTDQPGNVRLGDIAKAKAIFVLSTDLPIHHPIAWLRVNEARAKGAALILAGSGHHTAMPRASRILKAKSGWEALLAAALAEVLVRKNVRSQKAEGFTEFLNSLGSFIKAKDLEMAGLAGSEKEIEEAALALLDGKPSVVLFDENVTAGPGGSQVLAPLWNLSLLTGSRLMPLGLSSNDKGIFELERTLLPGNSVARSLDIRKGLGDRSIKALFLIGSAIDSQSPKPEMLICQDTHWTRSAESADVVFPAASSVECDSAFMNTEGRVQRSRIVVPPPGSARADRDIFAALTGRMETKRFAAKRGAALLREIETLLSAANMPGTEARRARVSKFLPFAAPSPAKPTARFPLLLSLRLSGELLRSFETAREIRAVRRVRPPNRIYLDPADAKKIRAGDGDSIEIEFPTGRMTGVVRISRGLLEGTSEMIIPGGESPAARFLHLGQIPVKIRRNP